MKIGVDLRPLQNHNRFRGIGRYLENVLRAIAATNPEYTFVFYVEKRSPPPEDVISLFKTSELRYVAPSRIKRIKYVRALARPEVKIAPQNNDVDVFFQADPWLGIPKNVPTVAAFLDIIPLLFKRENESLQLKGIKKYKQIFGEAIQSKFYKEMLESYSHAAAILAISKSSRDDYIAHVDKTALNKVSVALLAGSETSFPEVTKAARLSVRKKYKLSDSPFLLYVGGIDLRKNISGLAKDFVKLKKEYPTLKLVMVGKEFGLKRDLKTVGWTKVLENHPTQATDIHTIGFVTNEDLAVLYAEATAFTFPSLYEGFGLPVLEAMHLGCPVVCYDNSSLPEVAGDAAILVKTGESLAPAIKRILDDPKLRAELTQKGKNQAKGFTWGKTAEQTLKILEEVAARK